MAERLALCILPGTRWSAQEIQTIAREAEESGFDVIFTNEFGNDALATAELMGAATHRILVGTYIINIYLRHPYVCAQGAALMADATGGRFVLGLGVSHQHVNEALGIDMQHPPTALRRYVTAVQSWLRGESPLTALPQRPAAHPVPVYVAALASHAVELGGELADGIMPFMWPAARVTQSQAWAARGRAKAPGRGPLAIALGIPTLLGDDLEALHTAARQNLGFYTTLPFLQRLFRVSGFAAEAAQMEQGGGAAALTDRLLDATCLLGPVARCQEQLAPFRAAGVDLPILVPSSRDSGVEEVRRVIQAFRR
jgi:alkanesulfonate monooxygenase SsuD/methylene tetrahydromethanopterin reductase-like flavin-dependent oxidoreductase (luciferase family)